MGYRFMARLGAPTAYVCVLSKAFGFKKKWRRIPAGIDILATHTPPYGILDLPTARTQNLGCPFLLEELSRIKPRVHVFGHIHASHGESRDDRTLYLNTAIVGGRDMQVRNSPTVKEVDAV